MMGLGLIVAIAGVWLIAYLLGWLPARAEGRAGDTGVDPYDILRERYAKGDIRSEHFQRMREELSR